MQSPEKTVRQLIRRFEEEGPDYDAMDAVPVENAATVSALVDGLSSREFRARRACAQALARATVEQETAARAVARLLDDDEDLTVAAAGMALGRLAATTSVAVPPLLQALASYGESIVRETLEGLLAGGGCASPEVAAHVQALARSKGPLQPGADRWEPDFGRGVALHACQVLAHFPGEATRTALESALESSMTWTGACARPRWTRCSSSIPLPSTRWAPSSTPYAGGARPRTRTRRPTRWWG